jgi:acetolactate synthase-1/2/3 large subunit
MVAAEAVVHCLLEEGVDLVFGYPGGAVLPLYEALRTGSVRHVLVRQEQSAVHSANAYARISGRVGVCIGTSGPGATNLVTGIATAYMDSIPLVVITGQVKTGFIGRDVFQEVDITGASESFTKHNYLVRDAQQLPRIIREAFHIASTGRPGPVLIDIPMDIQMEKIRYHYPKDVFIRGYRPTEKGHMGQIKRALKAIRESRHPLVFAGGGIFLADAQDELRRFTETTGIPVVHTLMGTGCMPTDHPHLIGMVGSHGFSYANKAMEMADLLIFIGARIADRATGGIQEDLLANRSIIHIDVDPAEIGKNVGCDIPVVGDVKIVLQQMLDLVQPLPLDKWRAELASMKEAAKAQESLTFGALVNPKHAVRILSGLLDDDAILVADVGQNQFWSARNFHIHGKRRFLCSGGFGTMGYSIPAGVGAKMAAPDRTVVSIMGDGSFQMSMHELGTIKANRIALKMVLFNNGKLGMVRELQDNRYKETFGVMLDDNPDFTALVSAYGFPVRKVKTNGELETAFRDMLAQEGPFFVECMVDSAESTL